MPTAQQIVTRQMQALGILGRNGVPTAADYNDAIAATNAMLDSWSGENLFAWANQTIAHTLTINTSSYTIGSGGAINTTRPDNISQAWLRDSNGLDYPMSVVPQYIWNGIGDKSIDSQIPTTLFYDPQYPLGIVNIFPVPLLAYSLRMNAILQQTTFSSVTHSLSAPPGYERAMILQGAVELMSAGFPCLLDEKGLARLYENADKAMANIKRKNIKEQVAAMDDAIVSHSYASYNIYSDGMPRN